MSTSKEPFHGFIIRIWIEHRDLKGAEPIWRGEIEDLEARHPQAGQTVYFDRLEKLSTYFARYLQKIGINVENSGK